MGKPQILEAFGELEPGKAHGKLLSALEDFFEHRNAIAHALKPGQSSGASQIVSDINLLESFGKALLETINAHVKTLVKPLKDAVTAAGQPADT